MENHMDIAPQLPQSGDVELTVTTFISPVPGIDFTAYRAFGLTDAEFARVLH
jgi:hypothetical protein